MTRRALLPLALLALAAFGVQCTDPPAPPDAAPVCTGKLTAQWGQRVGPDFMAFHDGDDAPITFGFQGFRFVASVARLEGVGATTGTFIFQVTLDGHDPSTQNAGRVDLKVGPDGALYADGLQLFFNDIPVVDVLGRNATVVLVAQAAGCTAQSTVRVKLVRGGCQSADGGTECPDGGP